jgi:serine phosphatase RsbU (regulator of sigma subunit)/anti-sigma regulatory factor (Ser/Thr protein kinase)/anti-anti-sigma regulatory factor
MDDLRLAALDQAPLILAVCEGPQLRVRFLSAATRAVLPGREWLGRPIGEVINDLVGQQITDAYYEVYRTGEPIIGREWRVHLDRPDGSFHEMYANFSITPWLVDGERRGVVGVGFDVTEMAHTRSAAAEAAAHLQARYEQSRDVITALQRELLPSGLPVLPGAQIAAGYLLADQDTAAGGDWFDAVARPDGKVALVTGDVVGHGVAASGVMGQLRAVLQDRLSDGEDPASALAAADRFARRRPIAHATTVCVAVLDPATGDLTYCTAGHPAPLIIPADAPPPARRPEGTPPSDAPEGTAQPLPTPDDAPEGTAQPLLTPDDAPEGTAPPLLTPDDAPERMAPPGNHLDGAPPASTRRQPAGRRLAGTGGTPLGTSGSFPVRTERLEVGELLLMFTDGILERPGRTHDASLAELAQVAAHTAAGRALHEPDSTPAERVCSQTIEMLVRATGHNDDITLLAVQRLPRVRDLDLDLPAEPAALRRARAEIASWLEELGAGGPDVIVLQHALGELMTNAIEHGRGAAAISVRATLTDSGRIDATVTDRGRWREPVRQPLRGRGLALTAQLVDNLLVTPTDDGTQARIEFQLCRPARLLGPASGPSRPDRPEPGSLRITELSAGDETSVRVDGPIDAETADLVGKDLLRRGRGGTVGLTVDLSGVTHLSSAGVSVLHQVASRHAEQKAPLRFEAPEGSPARIVLDLVALPLR